MIWRFGEFEVDVPLFQLRRGDTPLKLERLVFDLLLYLIEERRRVVLRHELIVRLWPRETVVPTALARVVSTLPHRREKSRRWARPLRTRPGRYGWTRDAARTSRMDRPRGDSDARAPGRTPKAL